MKRAAFTMIELIFVIVILGILASVAIPKLASVQDDAQISVEQQGVGAMRGGLTALHSKRKMNPTIAITSVITDQQNGVHTVLFAATATAAHTANSWSTAQYPWDISITGTLGTTNATAATTQAAGTYGTTATTTAIPGLLVVELDNVAQWGTVADGNGTYIKGPASNTVTDTAATINTTSRWIYTPGTGNIIFDANSSSTL